MKTTFQILKSSKYLKINAEFLFIQFFELTTFVN
jgi:hypothetical protein